MLAKNMKHFETYRRIYLSLALALCLPLSGCFKEPTAAVSYGAVSYIDEAIASIVVNGEGGILGVYPHAGGAPNMCCVVIPRHWKPGLKATIKWQMDGHWVRDSQGKIVVKDGSQDFVEGIWKQKVVDIPEYKEVGGFMINFFPNDEVKVLVTNASAGYPGYPYPDPDPNRCWDGVVNTCKGK
ncbi:DUF3304 domain-containing protein [Sulfurirhabdus autotrophica]|uniref:Uncharacterized protein DUF3304 n=2 Tax=Sulfurirhabdus autotrophica TaxID=1706046 RepID=A0A4R3XWF0_9PROT|nr:DUF3304 domain-containing protein [Sulfurirhabdus autotrophica]TCV81099.1 uncharacterized protein DUF3304 [Sulfurirhabdus autotrophica]